MSDRRANQFRGSRAGGGKRQAFTLIEVTISVALALVLMLGISEVFRVVGETVGTGEALAVAQRDSRAAQAVMAGDFKGAVTDGAPFMLLSCQQQFAFRNQADLLGDKDADPTTFDVLGTGTESGQVASVYNYRSHRIDTLTFFARGSFARQTGADVPSGGTSPFVSNMSSTEAMLWYGHLNLANNAGTFSPNSGTLTANGNTPGAGTTTLGASNYYTTSNPNNFFASSWILGRQEILLRDPSPLNNNRGTFGTSASGSPIKEIVDASLPGVEQYACTPTSIVDPPPSLPSPPTALQSLFVPPLAPLAVRSLVYPSSKYPTVSASASGSLALSSQGISATLLSGRVDLSATSIAGFNVALSNYITAYTSPAPLNVPPAWYALLPGGANNLRFQAQPFFLTKPATPESMAYQIPIFVRGCTQFTVDFAGDYLNQSVPAALITNANQGINDTWLHHDSATNTYSPGSTDGQIDFIYVNVPVAPTSTQGLLKKIRWYGLPRSTTNNVSINRGNGDVVPLRDVLAIAADPANTVLTVPYTMIPTQAPFEKVLPFLNSGSTTISTDYAATANGPGTTPTAIAMAKNAQYIAAWAPTDVKPKMIRITMTIDDPGGRLGDGQTFEYIYTLP